MNSESEVLELPDQLLKLDFDIPRLGKCRLRACSCLEIRVTSMMWKALGKCENSPNRLEEFACFFWCVCEMGRSNEVFVEKVEG